MNGTSRVFAIALVGAVLFTSCSKSDGGGEADPCAANGGCGQICGSDTECDQGLHCGTDGVCTATCVASDDTGCHSGFACSERGRCLPTATTPATMWDGGPSGGSNGDAGGMTGGAASDAVACGWINTVPQATEPVVLLLIDHSGSMVTEGRNGSSLIDGKLRWDAMVLALADPQNGVLPRLDKRVAFGALLYDSDKGTSKGFSCPRFFHTNEDLTIDVKEPRLGNGDNIIQVIADNRPSDSLDTPTGDALKAAVAYMKTISAIGPDEEPQPKIIILATDGEPDRCTGGAKPWDAHDDKSKKLVVDTAAEAWNDHQIRTFILSVGNDVGETHLDAVAQAGNGTKAKATSHTELTNAFIDIVQGVRSCDFRLMGEVAPGVDPGRAVITLNDQPLEHPTDWTLDDNRRAIILSNDACQIYKYEASPHLEARFPCDTFQEEL